MDILFFSINIVGCIVYFLFSLKMQQKKNHPEETSEKGDFQSLDSRLSKIEKQIEFK